MIPFSSQLSCFEEGGKRCSHFRRGTTGLIIQEEWRAVSPVQVPPLLSRRRAVILSSHQLSGGSVCDTTEDCLKHITRKEKETPCTAQRICGGGVFYGSVKYFFTFITLLMRSPRINSGVNNENNTSKCPNKPHTRPLMLICRSCFSLSTPPHMSSLSLASPLHFK